MIYCRVVAVVTFFLLSLNLPAQTPKNFGQAKKDARLLFAGQRLTLYCRCPFNARLEVDLAGCGIATAQKITARLARGMGAHDGGPTFWPTLCLLA